ncbi:hypothetical protein LIER_07590 [Lithospermum erythrorhizon]|uniref:Glabrous enhancer-binding protein-like DBD domain-containing protein n=1 Tax=Lithospermum erythrorhizon TaxID=34254 RepID=A0AAV3PCN0_LITER
MNLRSTTTPTPTPTPNHTNSTPIPPSKTPPSGRLFTEQDEIKLLKAYKKSIRKNPNSTPSSLSFGKFSQTQISSKIKRLKEKYHKMAKTKSNIKTHQDRKIYLLGCRIWGKKNGKTSKVSKNDENVNNFKTQDDEASKDGIFEDGLDLDNGNIEDFMGANGESGKADVDLEKFKKGSKISKVSKNSENGNDFNTQVDEAPKDVIFEDGLDFDNGNTEKNMGENGDDLRSGKNIVDLEKFPFLMENVSEEAKKIGFLYFEGLKGLGAEKLKELDDKWMILSMQKAEIETEKSLLFQKQFILVVDARRRM